MKKVVVVWICFVFGVACSGEESKLGDKYYKQGEYQKAIDAYTEYISLQPRDIKSIYNRGRAYQEIGKHKEALADFNLVVKEDPLNTNALLSITTDYYSRLHDYENTIFYADKVLELDKNNAIAHTLKGKSFQKLGKLKEAMSAYNDAISVNKEYVDAYLSRGSLRVYLNQIRNACADFQLAQVLKPGIADKLVKKYCK